ncbi:MAG TPA: EAL domain-containing protein [Sphingobium sp.]|nr:EAL domain-containing protein [Sphingobium sp.]
MRDTHKADQLLVIRCNNFAAVEAAFGKAAAGAAMDHLRRVAERHLGRVEFVRMERDEIELSVRHPVMRCLSWGSPIELLCTKLGAEPFRHGDNDILLSVSAGHAWAQGRMAGMPGRSLEGEARAGLAVSTLTAEGIVRRLEACTARYRKDMAAAATLVRQIGRGAGFFTWRPICRPGRPEVIFYYEAALRCMADEDRRLGSDASYAALDRLGLAHLVDRPLLADVIEELEADPTACLSIGISTRSLSLNLHGEEAGWTDLIERLRRDPAVARRLIVEIADNSGIACFRDALSFVRALRDLGVRIVVARFGSGQASIGQLMALSPDLLKLDSAFMQAAYRSASNRARFGRLLSLARTISPTVIVDGVESPWHMKLAVEEGAEWIAGAQVGRPALRRGWLDAGYGDSVASLAAFNSAFRWAGQPGALSR